MPPAPEGRVAVTGARSLVGSFLLPRLRAAGHEVAAFSRSPPAGPVEGVSWFAADLESTPFRWPAFPAGRLVHVAPLWLAPGIVEAAASNGVRRLVAFGSTSRFTKARSAVPAEAAVARRLAEAEEDLAAACERAGVAWTVFRPTLIYGARRDANVEVIARLLRRTRLFPVVGGGRGRRQPVHADDLAAACVAALDAPPTYGRAYDLTGGTTLRYRELVAAVGQGAGVDPWIVSVPAVLVRALLRVAAALPGLGHLTPAMADRMQEDLVFDSAEAVRDFGYAPRAFAYPDGECRPSLSRMLESRAPARARET